jgi:hypothetical protein
LWPTAEQTPGSILGTPSTGGPAKASSADTSPEGNLNDKADISDTLAQHDIANTSWPTETDLLFPLGRSKMSLNQQTPLIHAVIQDSFECLRAYLLFTHAFPDAFAIPVALSKALTDAAKMHYPKASAICDRLLQDPKYMGQMARLVSGPSIQFRF